MTQKQPRYLTKSRFKLALECSVKLYYTGKKQYKDNSLEDTFLEALAEGGFQVGELAKLYYPGGTDIKELGYDAALKKTNELLKQDKAIIYEAAFKHENLFIRADVLLKDGNHIELIEVKAKSYNRDIDGDFTNDKGYIKNSWSPYLYDVAFQKYVIYKAFPEFHVSSYLMLADKNSCTSVDGLNQKFMLVKDSNGRTKVKLKGETDLESLGSPILIKVPVDNTIQLIYDGIDTKSPDKPFIELVEYYSKMYSEDKKISVEPGSFCKLCQFSATKENESEGYISGFKECFKEHFFIKDEDFEKPMIFDIWDLRDKDALIKQDKLFIEDCTESDIAIKSNKNSGLSRTERQWLQVEKVKNKDTSSYIDKTGLAAAMSQYKYPLHFIDFETSAVAIPFNKNTRPYEIVAFQFSHHTLEQNGLITHAGEYINKQRGVFPNFDFLRQLKKELDKDEGTIFRFSHHENTVLTHIHDQLNEQVTDEVPDRHELMDFIETITTRKEDRGFQFSWVGVRSMIDICELVKLFYYNPLMGGSNSIKKVLPAVLNESVYLKDKYSKPIYGSVNGIKSLNYKDKVWIEYKEGVVKDPYKTLPPVFDDSSIDELDRLVSADSIADGGAAMTAYAKMQFSKMTDVERDKIIKSLLRYCELDTFAMVLIYEHWFNEINKS